MKVVDLQNEVDLLRKIQNPNIICLLGCSSQGDSRFIVYELMQNGSLEKQLHGMAYMSIPFFNFVKRKNKNVNGVVSTLIPYLLFIYLVFH